MLIDLYEIISHHQHALLRSTQGPRLITFSLYHLYPGPWPLPLAWLNHLNLQLSGLLAGPEPMVRRTPKLGRLIEKRLTSELCQGNPAILLSWPASSLAWAGLTVGCCWICCLNLIQGRKVRRETARCIYLRDFKTFAWMAKGSAEARGPRPTPGTGPLWIVHLAKNNIGIS